jgi:hypothetical protein
MSPWRAAGSMLIITVPDPLAITPGPFGTQVGNVQIAVLSLTRAAGWKLMTTVGEPEMMASGKAGCGAVVGVGAAG